MKVAMTKDWRHPDGKPVEVADYIAARKWILEEAERRKLRLAGYERTIIDRGEARHIVDFGDYSVFGMVMFDSVAETPGKLGSEAVVNPPEKLEKIVLGTLPVSVSELELAIHSACDAGRWKWVVRLDGNSLVLEEPWK